MAVVRRRSAPHTGRSRGAEQTVVEPYGFPRRVQLRGAGHRSVVRARRGLRGLRIKKGIGMICVALSPRAAGTRFTRRVRHPSRPKLPRTPQRAETSIESVFTREQRGGACSPEQNGTAHNAAALPLQLRPCHGCRGYALAKLRTRCCCPFLTGANVSDDTLGQTIPGAVRWCFVARPASGRKRAAYNPFNLGRC